MNFTTVASRPSEVPETEGKETPFSLVLVMDSLATLLNLILLDEIVGTC